MSEQEPFNPYGPRRDGQSGGDNTDCDYPVEGTASPGVERHPYEFSHSASASGSVAHDSYHQTRHKPSMTPQGEAAYSNYSDPYAVSGQSYVVPVMGQQRKAEADTRRRVGMGTLFTAVLVASLVGGAMSAVTMNTLNGSQPVGSSALPALEAKPAATRNLDTDGSVQDVAAKVMPSVVTIQVRTARGGDKGSGSILSADGTVITNNHVVADAADDQGEIVVGLNDGRVFPARIIARDPESDIAVIQMEGADNLTPISLGDSSQLKVGQEVVAIGSPLGLDATVTSGIVSAMNRPVQAGGRKGEESSLIDAIQTDAPINPGNSGGALVDMDGNLIGIPSVIATLGGAPGLSQSGGSIGLGFAIPINHARNISEQLIKTGRVQHPVIGVTINPRADVRGASIVDVPEGSPADKAGLKSGDVVVKVDNRSVDSGIGLIAAIRSHKVGDEVKLDIVDSEGRNPRTVTMKLAPEGSHQG